MTDEEKLIEQVARAVHEHLSRRDVMQYLDNDEDCAGIARAILPIIKAEVDKWREPIIDELMSCHIYRREHEADPRKALHEVITWNCRVALDPAVSAEARALMARGGEMVLEAAAEHCEQWSSRYREAQKNAQARKQRQEARDFESMEIASAFRAFEIRALSVPAIVEAGDGGN